MDTIVRRLDRNAGMSRRDVLQQGLRAGAGGAVVWLVGARAFAEPSKLAKAAVQYTDAGKMPGKDCDDCIQFMPGATAGAPASCRIVEGVIAPHGHCIAFTPKPTT